MSHTEKEIVLCRRLHELGVRPEIQEGDWCLHEAMKNPFLIENKGVEYSANGKYREGYILLWSWERAREWLREKGWDWIEIHGPRPKGKKYYCAILSDKERKWDTGYSDLEAILAAMCQVAEEK